MNHPEQNLEELSIPSAFNKEGWRGLIAFLAFVETVEYVNGILYAHTTGGGCPASEEYAKAFPALVKAVQEQVDKLSEVCVPVLPQLKEALDQYEYARLYAIANCSKEDCTDREVARKQLSWVEEDEVLL